MANTTPILDLLMFDTHNSKYIAIADGSVYPTNFSIITPTLQVTPPNFPMQSFEFTPKNVMILNSFDLAIACSDVVCDLPDLPDGIWKVTYSVAPSYQYSVEKNFLRVSALYEKYDTAYLKLDIFNCDGAVKRQDEKILNEIEEYIQGAIAAADKCALKLAMTLYNKASTMLDNFIANRCYVN